MIFRVLFLIAGIVVSETGFVEDNHKPFDGLSELFKDTPVSYQSFVTYDKFSNSDHNALHVQSSRVSAKSTGLFKPADYADQAAYQEEVEKAHRLALSQRRNNTDAAYQEAYTNALKSQRKVGSISDKANGNKHNYNSHLQYKFGLDAEDSSLYSKRYFQDNYDNVGKEKYYSVDNHDIRKSVEYVVAPGYVFNDNGVLHPQPHTFHVAETKQFTFAPERYDSSPAIKYA